VAGTPTGRTLTEQHRADQATIRTRVAADVAVAWRLLDPARLDATTPAWLAVMLDLLGIHRADSAHTAAAYYSAHRTAELADRTGTVPPAAVPDPERRARPDRNAATVSLLVCGPSAIKAATAKGVPPEQSTRRALARVTGAATRHALNGGRAVLRDAVKDDQTALGWIRVIDADPCAFCAMLASRGPVYKTKHAALWADGTAGQDFHDGCACTAEPVYDAATPWPGRAAEFAALWADATDGLSGDKARAAFRAAIDARRGSAGTSATRPEQVTDQAEHVLQDAVPAARVPDLTALSDEELSDAFLDATAADAPDSGLVDRIAAELDRRDAVVPDPDPLDGLDLTTVPDHVLFDLWRQHDRSAGTVERIAAELDRRDRGDLVDEPDPDTVGDDDADTLDYLADFGDEIVAVWAAADAADEAERIERARQAAVDARIDTLIARGWDYLDAYADVHGTDVDELRRQERTAVVDEQRRAGETRDQAARRLYDEWVHLQWLAAETATNGYLLSAAGVAAGIDPRTLWGGTADRARRYASEELKRWWVEHPRRTLTEFRADLLGRAGDVAAAARAVGRGNDRDFGL
jgi:hypothetical protein